MKLNDMLLSVLVCEVIILIPIVYMLFVYPIVSFIENFVKGSPKDGDERIVMRFLLFPKCIDGKWRWMRKVEIKQRYETVYWDDIMGVELGSGWVNKSWGCR